MSFLVPVIFLIGLCIGSFLNVVVFRTHDGRSIARGRSKCMKCERMLGPLDLVPVVSYVLLRGRCRTCKAVVSWQYPVMEFALGILFVFAYLRYANAWFLPDYISPDNWPYALARDWIFIAVLAVLFVYDLRYSLILDRFTVPAMILAIVANLLLGAPATSLLLGGLVLGGFFFVQHAISKGAWVGGGDIRMGMLMGFMLGMLYGLVALFLAYALGALVGVWLLARRKAKMQTQVPFGTFLAIGTLVMLFFGDGIVNWYLGLLY